MLEKKLNVIIDKIINGETLLNNFRLNELIKLYDQDHLPLIKTLLKQVDQEFIDKVSDDGKEIKVNEIAIVGSSCRLFDKKMGEEINKADLVIRMNSGGLYVSQYPEYMGNRTDILNICAPFSLPRTLFGMDTFHCNPKKIQFNLKGGNTEYILYFLTFLEKNCFDCKISLLMWSSIFKDFGSRNLTAGFMTILQALSIAKKINVFSLGNLRRDNKDIPPYYYDNSMRETSYLYSNKDDEFNLTHQFYLLLEKRGLINIYE